jgi:uncharacterized protein YjiS (DUF1127 family)
MSPFVAIHSPVPAVTRLPRESAATRALGHVFGWLERARSRRQLAELDDRMLADIGIDRATAHAESERPFWLDSRARETESRTLLDDRRSAIRFVR